LIYREFFIRTKKSIVIMQQPIAGALQMRSRQYSPFLQQPYATMLGMSSAAPGYWRTANQLLREAARERLGKPQQSQSHFTVPSAICLYHATLDCFMNEELAFSIGYAEKRRDEASARAARRVQDMPLSVSNKNNKPESFQKLYEIVDFSAEIERDVVTFIRLRDRLYHHTPEFRPIGFFPDDVIAALEAASIIPIGTSWFGECCSIKLAEWCAKTVQSYIEEFCRGVGVPSRFELPGWER
jgi:hypothetical protein